MNRAEIDAVAVEWAAREGWNPGWHDSDAFYAADPNGFLIGLLDDEPIASISAVRYGQGFGFIGFYIVKPEYRGKGYGIQIWNAALDYLKGRNIGLDGVVAKQDNYKKSGFYLAYRNVRYQGQGGSTSPHNPDIVPLDKVGFEEVRNYDRSFFPEERTAFLKTWIRQPESTALGILRNGKLAGYGMIRLCRTGAKIGPLFANDPNMAESLFDALRATLPSSEPIYLDVPEVNPAAVNLAQRKGMTVVFETARMYTGEKPELPLDRLFGVTSFELG